MSKIPGTDVELQDLLNSLVPTTIKVVTDPADFYRGMQRSGGFQEPLLYMIILGVVAGLLRCVLGLFGLGMAGTAFVALAMIILYPIFAAVGGFVMGGILFGIWKFLGSEEPYETAYRCGAYMAAIAPFTTIVSAVPYLGTLVGVAWTTYLLVVASTEVHRVEVKKAWIVFGVIGAILALGSLSSEMAARRINASADRFQKQMEKMQEMTPEEAGKRVGEFMKGLEEGSGKPHK